MSDSTVAEKGNLIGPGAKRILFVDRDGVIIKEAPPTYQLDSFSKLEFYPDMFCYLRKIDRKSVV